MGRKKLLKYYIYFILVALAGIVSCGRQGQKNGRTLSPPVKFDLDSIKHRGKIILLTENSASTYYLYRGQAKGFDYELVKSFAEHIGVQLEVHILDDVDEMFELLNKGEGDLIASNLTITHEREKFVRFSNPLYFSRQMLVQRKYDVKNPDSLFKLLTDTAALDQLPVWVHEYSSFYSQLKKMESRSGKKFAIEEAPGNISTDDLVRLTASGEVNATVTDENLAQIQRKDYPELDMSLALTGKEPIGWAIRSNAKKLSGALNSWLESPKTQKKIERTYKKYFGEDQLLDYRGPFVLPELSAHRISVYDSLFKKYAPEINWDWRLLAALVYQESRFNPNAESWSGAFGLMQLMPVTAKKFGCDSGQTEEPNIRAGVHYLKFLERFWRDKIPNPEERLKFVLASYNIGPGHILDAQVIAQSTGKNDTLWNDHVAECLLLKTQKQYYSMEGVKHGYCRAQEPFHFVNKILAVFEHYKSIVKK